MNATQHATVMYMYSIKSLLLKWHTREKLVSEFKKNYTNCTESKTNNKHEKSSYKHLQFGAW